MLMKCVYLNSITDISSDSWNSVVNDSYPFLRHEFLAAMELSKSACSDSGWKPQHLTVYDEGSLVAVMPLYIKYHSYGEYIFDWDWSRAYERHNLDYYPKLLSAIPFTPATGPRLTCKESANKGQIHTFVSNSLLAHAKKLNSSSIHILAPDHDESTAWGERNLKLRISYQYHWFNENYKDFDDFLKRFTSRKRKNLKKERSRIEEQGVSVYRYIGDDISASMWDTFYHYYQITYAKRSGHGGYLRREFFDLIHETMSENIMLVMAKHNGQDVAGALYFFDSTTLYGRYWGCTQEFELLHFEVCYYQGIQFCIERGLKRFDAGAQGEHKIQRGFTPVEIYSNHWIANEDFSAAISGYIDSEAERHTEYINKAKKLLPFKNSDN